MTSITKTTSNTLTKLLYLVLYTLNLLNIKNLTIKHIDVKICGPTEKPPKLMTFAH